MTNNAAAMPRIRASISVARRSRVKGPSFSTDGLWLVVGMLDKCCSLIFVGRCAALGIRF